MNPLNAGNPKNDILFLRLMLWVLFVPCFLIMQGSSPMPVYCLSGALLGYSLLLFIFPAISTFLDSVFPITLFLDVLSISGALYLLESWYIMPIATFYIFPIIAHSFQSKPVIPYLIAAVSSAFYLTIGILRNLFLAPLLVQVIIFFIMAFFASFLAQYYHSAYFQQANLDTLTRIHNRRFFNFFLNKLMTNKTPFSLILIDIDNFKQLNDTQGHQHGDYVLKIIAGLLKECTRSTDIAARFGGDEFSVILPRSSKEESRMIAERIRNSVLVNPRLLPYPNISISLGIASYPQDGNDLEEILQKADAALYKAKSLGKNSVYYYKENGD